LRYPALLRLMQGFAADASFYKGSGLTASAGETLLFEDLDTLVTRVRALEVGKRYQQFCNRPLPAKLARCLQRITARASP
jgi:hypothetical protein